MLSGDGAVDGIGLRRGGCRGVDLRPPRVAASGHPGDADGIGHLGGREQPPCDRRGQPEHRMDRTSVVPRRRLLRHSKMSTPSGEPFGRCGPPFPRLLSLAAPATRGRRRTGRAGRRRGRLVGGPVAVALVGGPVALVGDPVANVRGPLDGVGERSRSGSAARSRSSASCSRWSAARFAWPGRPGSGRGRPCVGPARSGRLQGLFGLPGPRLGRPDPGVVDRLGRDPLPLDVLDN